jgi:hypothetical protein
VGAEQLDQVGVQAAVLQAAGDRGREQSCGALLTVFRLAAEESLR